MLLATRLPAPYRLAGTKAWVIGIVMAITVLLGLYSGIARLFS